MAALMPRFRYRARTAAGRLQEGELEAASATAAAEQLLGTAVTPLEISETRAAAGMSAVRLDWWPQPRPSLTEISLFARQLYALTKAGVPLLRGLGQLAESTRNPVIAQAVREIASDLESGRDLAGAMARHPRVFSPLFINIVRVGEESGRLDESFLRIHQYLEADRETIKQIKAALRYPTLVVIAMVAAIFVLMTFVIPVFENLFSRFDMDLPWPTRVIIGSSHFMAQWWWLVLLVLGGALGGFLAYIREDAGRLWWDRLRLRLPIVGDIVLRASLARFARAFAMALSSGVPIIQALGAVSRALDNRYLGEKALGMRDGIARGESLARTAMAAQMFTPLVLQMFAVGDETGRVDELLMEVAEFYESEVAYDVRRIGELIQPLVILVMGVMVLILALGVFLPMWDMTRIASR